MATDEKPRIVAERDGVLAVEKPSGFAVHPTNDPTIPDLLSWLVSAGLASESLAPIHRLDRETSGIVLCSEDASVRGSWGRWFAEGEVEKEYLALVHGVPRRHRVLKKPLFDRRRRKALPAETHLTRRWHGVDCALLEVTPKTGRKHQIRQHLQGIGHAISGDRRYRPRRNQHIPDAPTRLWLHAARLVLPNGWELSSPLPLELSEHLDMLEQLASGGGKV